MTEEEAVVETKKLFGEDSFTEFDDADGLDRYYVGALPIKPGRYIAFMGRTWEEALAFAKMAQVPPIFWGVSGSSMHAAVRAVEQSAPLAHEALYLIVGNCSDLEHAVRDLTSRVITLETKPKEMA